ncbi:MAG: Ni/Fe hydrogenase subunit alpha [Chitinivibrionales bacterium]|nr:Ni/Fe hydrogenase subunit alpha [Chitinivibrionales bacterium]
MTNTTKIQETKTDTDMRRIVIDPVTRVEGHGKVTILLDNEGAVKQARLHIVEFRGFERFIQGRLLWEVPVIVQRLCGICPVSHHLGAAKAMDMIVGADELTPTAEKMRRLMHYGQIVQSHATHFFYLASPDLLFGFDAPMQKRNAGGVVMEHPDMAHRGVRLRKYGQKIIETTAGKRIHGTGAIPGGINKNLTPVERDRLLADADQAIKDACDALEFIKKYMEKHQDDAEALGAFTSNRLCILDSDGAMDLYDGTLRAVDRQDKIIFENEPVVNYLQHVAEEVRNWTYMKFPFIRQLGPKEGWYSVGSLPRVTACDYIDTPLAEKARREMIEALGGKASGLTMAYHWARIIEIIHGAEKIKLLLQDPDLLRNELVVKGKRKDEGISVIEAPRGTLFHHYRVDRNDQVSMANIIVSTTQNNEPMNRAVEYVARRYLQGTEITESMLNHIEAAIRAYDPCLSCATHAVGHMPLSVSLCNEQGDIIDRKNRAYFNSQQCII